MATKTKNRPTARRLTYHSPPSLFVVYFYSLALRSLLWVSYISLLALNLSTRSPSLSLSLHRTRSHCFLFVRNKPLPFCLSDPLYSLFLLKIRTGFKEGGEEGCTRRGQRGTCTPLWSIPILFTPLFQLLLNTKQAWLNDPIMQINPPVNVSVRL
jgi:hypothetical protein